MGGSIKRYPLMPDSSWEIDMEALDSLVDSRTKAILINNPSNPCGSSYSLQHISKVVAVAKKYRLPIIADEIYSGIVFDGEFCPFHLMCDEVPVITLGGMINCT